MNTFANNNMNYTLEHSSTTQQSAIHGAQGTAGPVKYKVSKDEALRQLLESQTAAANKPTTTLLSAAESAPLNNKNYRGLYASQLSKRAGHTVTHQFGRRKNLSSRQQAPIRSVGAKREIPTMEKNRLVRSRVAEEEKLIKEQLMARRAPSLSKVQKVAAERKNLPPSYRVFKLASGRKI